MQTNQEEKEDGSLLTSGEYQTEEDAARELDALLKAGVDTGALRVVYKEVTGQYFFIPPRGEVKCPRIDRIVVPGKKLEDAGWKHGPFGIEIKKSGHKAGPVVNQCCDYQLARFQVREGYWLCLEYVFVFPLERIGGDVESVMVNHRIGCASKNRHGAFNCDVSGCSVLRFHPNGEMHGREIKSGRKLGSR